MASFEGDKFTFPVTIVSKEMMNTWVFDEGKPSVKAIDRWRSAYANIVISEIVRIIITYVRQTEKQRLQRRCQSVCLKNSFGWIYGHQYYVIYAKNLFRFCFWKNYARVFLFYNTVLLPNKNIQSFHRRKAQG